MKTVTFLNREDLDDLQRGRPLIVQSEEGSDVELRFDDTEGGITLEDVHSLHAGHGNGKRRLKCPSCGATGGASGKPFKGAAGLAAHISHAH